MVSESLMVECQPSSAAGLGGFSILILRRVENRFDLISLNCLASFSSPFFPEADPPYSTNYPALFQLYSSLNSDPIYSSVRPAYFSARPLIRERAITILYERR